MGGEDPAPITMPQNAVVVNGAAINLITALVESARRDMREMKSELVKQIDDRFDTHEALHDLLRADELEFQTGASGRLTTLEAADRAMVQSAAVKAARREGQMSIIHGAQKIVDFAQRYGKLIALVLGVMFGLLLGTASGIQITVHAP